MPKSAVMQVDRLMHAVGRNVSKVVSLRTELSHENCCYSTSDRNHMLSMVHCVVTQVI